VLFNTTRTLSGPQGDPHICRHDARRRGSRDRR